MDMPPNAEIRTVPQEQDVNKGDVYTMTSEDLFGGEQRNNPNEEFITIEISNSAFNEKTGTLTFAITKFDLDNHFNNPNIPGPSVIYLVEKNGNVIETLYSIENDVLSVEGYKFTPDNPPVSINIDNIDFDPDAEIDL